MNCEQVQQWLMDGQEEHLDAATQRLAQEHLRTCADCQQAAVEWEALFNEMARAQLALPDRAIEERFLADLATEKATMASLAESTTSSRRPISLWMIIGTAATIALVMGSSWWGISQQQRALKSELAMLEQEHHQLNKLVALYLMDDPSASKRLQAVSYAETVPEQDGEILDVLIQKMYTDKHVNVRLAAANALARFVDNPLIVDAFIGALKAENNPIMQIELIHLLVIAQEKRAIPVMKQLLQQAEIPVLVKDEIKVGLAQMS